MKFKIASVLALLMLVLSGGVVLAGESSPTRLSYLKLDQESMVPAVAGTALEKDEQLMVRKADFEKFARAKIGQMNRNHARSRARMQISREADGSYRATFHEIDAASLGYEVNRSRSKSIPYVAVLTYREEIYAATGPTADQCRKGPFNQVGFIPNRHIFSYSKGTWN